MNYRRLGDAGLKVSMIALGGWINYGEGKVPADEAKRVVERAYESGINFFDLADIYGKGEAEKQMGEVLRQFPRPLRQEDPAPRTQPSARRPHRRVLAKEVLL